MKGRHFLHPLTHSRPQYTPPADALARAAELINANKKVTLFCGVGCRDAHDEVLELADKLGAPIVHTLRAKDIFDYGDPNVVGLTGLIGNPSGYHPVWDCEVLVMLGTNFPYDGFIPDGIEIIQVDQNVENIGKRAPVSVGLVAAMSDAELRRKFIELGAEPVTSTPAELRAFISAEIAKWRKVIETAGIRAD